MNNLKIRLSKKMTIRYLLLSVGMLCFFISLFLVDKTFYPKVKSFYWIAFALFGLISLYLIYQLTDRSPQYVITGKGIYTGRKRKFWLWSVLSSFEIHNVSTRYIVQKRITLLDRDGNGVLIIDLTHADISLEKVILILKNKLRQQMK